MLVGRGWRRGRKWSRNVAKLERIHKPLEWRVVFSPESLQLGRGAFRL